MKLLNELKFVTKGIIILVLPVSGLLFFSISNVIDKQEEYNEMERLNELAELSQSISAFVHETQKERGNTAGFLGSGGTEFSTGLIKQKKSTDGKANELNVFITNMDKSQYGIAFEDHLADAFNEFDKISTIRKEVSSQQIKI